MTRQPNEPLPKSEYGPGPWQDEPDRLDWTDEATGLPCRIIRAPVTGALCGYVGVRDGHPWYGLPYNAKVKPPRDFAQRKMDERVNYLSLFIHSLGDDEADGAITIDLALEVHGGCTFADFMDWADDDGCRESLRSRDNGRRGVGQPRLAPRDDDDSRRGPAVPSAPAAGPSVDGSAGGCGVPAIPLGRQPSADEAEAGAPPDSDRLAALRPRRSDVPPRNPAIPEGQGRPGEARDSLPGGPTGNTEDRDGGDAPPARDAERDALVERDERPLSPWYFGFDCSHAGDVCPAMNALMRQLNREHPELAIPMRERRDWETYRTLDYVRVECAGLARQLHNLLAPQESTSGIDVQDQN